MRSICVYQITLNSRVFKRFLTTGVVGITQAPFFFYRMHYCGFHSRNIGTATRHGELITDVKMMDSRYGRINYYISPVKLYNETGYVWIANKTVPIIEEAERN